MLVYLPGLLAGVPAHMCLHDSLPDLLVSEPQLKVWPAQDAHAGRACLAPQRFASLELQENDALQI